MWSLLSWKNELVTIALHPQYMALSWIKPSSGRANIKQHQPFELKAYSVVPLHNLEYAHCRLFNPTFIKKHILVFLAQHKLKNAYVAMAISGPEVTEQFIASPIATPTVHDFTFSGSPTLLWDYVYLYPKDDGTFLFYTCGIKQEQLLQYKLLAVATNMRLMTVITERMALLNLYRHMQGPVFRHSQLAVAMERTNNSIEQLCTPDTLRRILMIDTKLGISFVDQAPILQTALGVVLSNGLYERQP